MSSSTMGIVGLGYVGLPLAMHFISTGINVVGVDTDVVKIDSLKLGTSYVEDVSDIQVQDALKSGKFFPTSKFKELKQAEFISICVPTPVGKTYEPDVSFVTETVENIANIIRRGQTIILESTVYPGATEELLCPILEKTGMTAGKDFFVAFSPERLDPGNTDHQISAIPKVIGGINEISAKKAIESYSPAFKSIIKVGSTKEAELTKLLENTFRAVNIALVNEMAIMAHGMDIDIWKVIDAAASKPFGFMPFYPGPGWGGHCIPVDPYYLAWRARMEGYDSGLIDEAGRINQRMPNYIIERMTVLMNMVSKPLKGSKILIIGMAYKRDVGDVRESPAVDVANLLVERDVQLKYHDPHISKVRLSGGFQTSVQLTKTLLNEQDLTVILADHTAIDYSFILKHTQLVFDTRAATRGIEGSYENLHTL